MPQFQTGFRNGGSVRDLLRYAALAWFACDARFRRIGWRGPLLLTVSVLDVFIYAAAISLVTSVVVGVGGLERFVLILIGLAVLRWSMSCAIQASRMAQFVKICAPVVRNPLSAGVLVAVAPSTVLFALTMLAIIVVSDRPVGSTGHIIIWGLMMFLIQLTWNVFLAIAVIQLRLWRILRSETPLVVMFGFLLILSPVIYQFSDIPQPASQLLTSFNPVSHLIAGYQNAIWYLNDVSLQILPLSAGLAVFGVAAITTLLPIPVETSSPGSETKAGAAEDPIYLEWRDGRWSPLFGSLPRGDLPAHRPWRGELPLISAWTLFHLLGPFVRTRPEQDFRLPESGRRLTQTVRLDATLSIYAESIRDQLCVLLALSTKQDPLVLDGVVDGLDDAGMNELTDVMISARDEERRTIVVSYNRNAAGRLARTAYR